LTFRRPKNCAKPLTGPADVWAFAVRKLKKHPILFTHPRPRLSLFDRTNPVLLLFPSLFSVLDLRHPVNFGTSAS
jgi:hypothetical protein